MGVFTAIKPWHSSSKTTFGLLQLLIFKFFKDTNHMNYKYMFYVHCMRNSNIISLHTERVKPMYVDMYHIYYNELWWLKCMPIPFVLSPSHVDVIKWKHFQRYWLVVRGIHWSPVNYPHRGQWRRALMLSLICARINGWVINHKAGDLIHHRAHYGITVMPSEIWPVSVGRMN